MIENRWSRIENGACEAGSEKNVCDKVACVCEIAVHGSLCVQVCVCERDVCDVCVRVCVRARVCDKVAYGKELC